jgi:hypothetical protein
MKISLKQGATVGFVVFSTACAGAGSEPKTAASGNPGKFTYAPALNVPYRETMTRYEEMSIPGTPVRDAERWTIDWDVMSSQESNLYKRTLKLVGLKLNVNGVDELRGDEVKASNASIDVLTDKDSNVVDVRGTDQLSAAIVALGTPQAQPLLKHAFSPELLKALVVRRSIEQHADFVGRPSQVGSQWMAGDANSGGTKQIRVVAEAPCDKSQCVQVERKYDVDRSALFAEVSDRVAAYVQSQGGDPSQVKLAGLDVKLEDSLTLEPATMDYHGARFDEDATLHVSGPRGELPVAFKLQRGSDYKY